MATTSVQKFLNQLSRNKNVQSFVNEFNRLGGELSKRGHELGKMWAAEKTKTIHEAQKRYTQVVKAVNASQKQLDREVNKALGKIQKSAEQVEKGLETYRKKALVQKNRAQKVIKSQLKSKKVTGARKKTAKKARRVSKKATR